MGIRGVENKRVRGVRARFFAPKALFHAPFADFFTKNTKNNAQKYFLFWKIML